MNKPQLYNILVNLNACVELLGAEIRKDKGALDKNLSDAADHIGTAFACVEGALGDKFLEVAGAITSEVEPEISKETQQLSDNQLEKAYGILKDAAKPGPKLLQTKMKIKIAVARDLYKQLTDSGRITKPTRKTTKPKNEDIESSVLGLIDQLPAGNDLLVSKHLHPLLSLENAKHRALYLSGLDINDYFNADDIARVTATGIDRTLVDQIVELQKTKSPIAKPDEIIRATSAEKGGDDRAQTYHKLRMTCIGAINKGTNSKIGKDLYLHMTRGGLTAQALADFKMIATAYSKGRA